MDVNEEIVQAWLQEQGFLVRGRLKFKVKGNRKSAGWSDIDLIAHRLHDGKKIAVDISAWMTETITLSYLKDATTSYRLFKITFPEARNAIKEYLGVRFDGQYETWLVVSKISLKQRDEVLRICHEKGIDRVIEFKEIMSGLIDKIKENPNPVREEESLQTIRNLVLCGLL